MSGTLSTLTADENGTAGIALAAFSVNADALVWRVQIGDRVHVPTFTMTSIGSEFYLAIGTVGPFTLADNGLRVLISATNAWGTSTVQGTLIVRGRPPSFTGAGTVQPASVSVFTGASVTLSGTAVGSVPLRYQWQKFSINIAGATTSSYMIPAAQLSDAGAYTLVATNNFGSVASAAATVTVSNQPLTITQQPQSRTVALGGTATFQVAVTGTPPIFYQWRLDGFNVEGATNSSLTISNVRSTDLGEYYVFVRNPAGTLNSAVVRLELASAPPPPPQPVAPTISQQPRSLSVTAGNPAAFQVTAAGTSPLSYEWRKDNVPISGATAAILNIANAQPIHAGNYTVVVTNPAGTLTSTTATLVVNVPVVPPAISVGPRHQDLLLGAGTELFVETSGSQPLSFQWARNGTAIGGATKSTLSFASIRHADAGAYSVTVSNAGGSTTSSVANLVVRNPGRLANLSILTSLDTPGDGFNLGFVVGGPRTVGTMPVLIRLAGPSLASFGVSEPLRDPRIEVFSQGVKRGENDDWGGGSILATTAEQVGAFPFASGTSKDAALLATALEIGESSVKASGAPDATGSVIAELYDASPRTTLAIDAPRMVNVSILKALGSKLVAGFVIDGTTEVTVLIRAIGPSLSGFDLSGFSEDPKVELLGGDKRTLATNNNWGGTTELAETFRKVGAFPLPDSSKDAALLAKLAPGAYTVEITSAAGASGMTLVELYEVP